MLLRRALPAAHFDRNGITPVTDSVHQTHAYYNRKEEYYPRKYGDLEPYWFPTTSLNSMGPLGDYHCSMFGEIINLGRLTIDLEHLIAYYT